MVDAAREAAIMATPFDEALWARIMGGSGPQQPHMAGYQNDFANAMADGDDNAVAQAKQNIWNQGSADQWSARQAALRAIPDNDPAATIHALSRQYAQEPFAPPIDRAFNQMSVDRQNGRFNDFAMGKTMAGTEGNFMNDPRVRGMLPAERDQAFQQVYGHSRGEYQNAQEMGQELGVPVSYADAAGLSPANQAKEMAWHENYKQTMGYSPSEALGAYDPGTGMANIPGRKVTRTGPDGEPIVTEVAGRQVHLDPIEAERLQEHAARLSGYPSAAAYNTARGARRVADENKLAALEQKKAFEQSQLAKMHGLPAPEGDPLGWIEAIPAYQAANPSKQLLMRAAAMKTLPQGPGTSQGAQAGMGMMSLGF